MMTIRYNTVLALLALGLVAGSARADGPTKPLFDGKTLDGWEVRGGRATYAVEDGMIVGTTVEGSPNTFLCTARPYTDFELKLDVLCDVPLNSGMQIRSHVYKEDTIPKTAGARGKVRARPAGTVYGYQCEVTTAEKGTAGNFWDEARTATWLDDFASKPEARAAFQDGQWNHYRIVAQGDHIRSWVNGVSCADFHDDRDAEGFIGLQVHGIKAGSGPYKVRWKDITIRELGPDAGQ